jgi:hypothetical protein
VKVIGSGDIVRWNGKLGEVTGDTMHSDIVVQFGAEASESLRLPKSALKLVCKKADRVDING